MNIINGDTKIIGFFGSTYKTGMMYAVYNAAFTALGLNYVYIPFAVGDLEKAIDGIRNLGVKAIGITMPFKIAVIKYLDELDEDAKKIGAVNVIINKNGKLIGGNTDGRGAVKALREKTNIENKKVVLLGAGGAARAIAFAVKDAGGTLTILNRNKEKAKDLGRMVKGSFKSLNQLKPEMEDADILINATSVGMTPNENTSLVKKEWLKPSLTILEIVSNPRETQLINQAKEAGCKIVYADRMLLWQSVLKFKYYTGKEPPIEVMERALKRAKLTKR